MSQEKKDLPAAIREFVSEQATVELKQIPEVADSAVFPYADYWRRAIAGMLLSGRIRPRNDQSPHRTDVDRVCKQANFNVGVFERFAEFLVRGRIVDSERRHRYVPGAYGDAFWRREVEGLQAASRQAFLDFVSRFTGREWRPTLALDSHLDAFVAAFALAFAGKAIREDKFQQTLANFAVLPKRDLHRLAKCADADIDLRHCEWEYWLDPTGQDALSGALSLCNWAYAATYRGRDWIFINEVGRVMLGLEAPQRSAPVATEFRVLPNRCILAGSDLPPEKLVPQFRCCKIARIDRVLEFQLDPRQLAEAPADGQPPAEHLANVLRELEPLPATVASALGAKPTTGEVRIRGCSAIVQPESPEVLDAIKKHGRLKGYLEAGAPPGYLLIKSQSNPNNFVARCREAGFRVKPL